MKTNLIAADFTGILTLISGGSFVALSRRRERYPPGRSSSPKEPMAEPSRGVTGSQVFDYKLRARAGQTMMIELKSDRRSEYFNLITPGRDEGLFVGSMSGSHFEGKVPADGEYTIRLYLMGDARDSGKTALKESRTKSDALADSGLWLTL